MPSNIPVNSFEAEIQLANAAMAAGDTPTVIAHLAAAQRLSPDDLGVTMALGHVKLDAGDIKGALHEYITASLTDAKSADAHACRALAQQLLGNSDDAQRCAEQALSLAADNLIALKVLTRINLNAQRKVEAEGYCRRVLALAPEDPDALQMMRQAAGLPNTPPPAQPANGAAPLPCASAKTRFDATSDLAPLAGLVGDYATRTEAWQKLGVEHLLQQFVVGDYQQAIAVLPPVPPAKPGPDGLPVPPAELTMGYGAGNPEHYLECGRRSYESLTKLLRQQQVTLGAGDAMLDWGGAAGRVVRCFRAEAQRGCDVWGCDVHAPSIQWAQNHLSPPFKFFNSSILPHLPFPDRHFKFIYGLSVVTHLITLRDLWLLELRRVLRPDGCLILTVHNESTWQWFRQHAQPHWMLAELRQLPEMPGECVEIRGSRWDQTYTFFHSDYLRRVWGQFFDIKDIVPCAEGYQTAVVMMPRPQ